MMDEPNLYEQYYLLRAKRLQLQHEADTLEQQEKDILFLITKDFNINNSGYSGQYGHYKMSAKRKEVPNCVDWERTLDYIRKTGHTDLLQKRLTDSAVKARWDSGVEVPGVDHAFKWAVSIERNTTEVQTS